MVRQYRTFSNLIFTVGTSCVGYLYIISINFSACHQNLYQDSTPCLAIKISTRTPPPASLSKSLPGLHPLLCHQNHYQDSTPFLAIKISTRTLPLLKGGAHQQKRTIDFQFCLVYVVSIFLASCSEQHHMFNSPFSSISVDLRSTPRTNY